MRVGVIQSSYLPWRGYFDLIDDVDLFLFYDDVGYSKGGWRNRNRIKAREGPQWLTVPVHASLAGGQPRIDEVRIDATQGWAARHVRTLTQAYRGAPHFERYASELFAILGQGHERLSELNVATTRWLLGALGIATETRMSSEWPVQGSATDRLLELLGRVGASAYLSGPSARAYLEPEKFRRAGIALAYKSYEYAPYPQQHGAFEPRVSALDLLFNCGRESRGFLKSLEPAEVVA